MPGPFPGMDPYLESPRVWRGVHNRLITYLADELNASLPGEYYAVIDERLYVLPWDQLIYPDVVVSTRSRTGTGRDAGVATVPRADEPLHVALVGEEKKREAFIEVRSVGADSRTVAVIELLSPSNKISGRGREEYQRKQRDILDSPTHLLEIDLLRGGVHTVAIPRDAITAQAGPFHYTACLHRGDTGAEFDVWAWTLRVRMPRIWVPLDPGVPDAVLDLQRVFDRNYEAGRYPEQVDYRGKTEPALSDDDSAWADALLREKGYRQ